jgi:CRISPR-associated protein Csy1
MVVFPVMQTFFDERKEAWLKSKLTAKLSEEEQAKIIDQADNKFALHVWLQDAAKRVQQLSMVSHPSKFSHPSAKTSAIIAQAMHKPDGYLRTGNIQYELDIFGNAAAMDVYKFLMLAMTDGQSVLAHLEQDSDEIKQLFHSESVSYQALKDDFMSIKAVDDSAITDKLVKQVYFPMEDNEYHLLSLLTPSGLITALKSRIDHIRFSEETKQAKEHRRNNTTHPTGYDDILDLTVMGYGGTQPQNVSVLNSKNAGRAYLLPSTPPSLKHRSVKLPNRDFFASNLRRKFFADGFETLHRLTQLEINNVSIREGINNTLKFMIDQILEQAFKVRATGGIGWSQKENYANLSKSQAIWLDDAYLETRETTTEWIEEISRQMVAWLVLSFEQSMKQNKQLLGGDELAHIKQFAREAIAEDQEFFK